MPSLPAAFPFLPAAAAAEEAATKANPGGGGGGGGSGTSPGLEWRRSGACGMAEPAAAAAWTSSTVSHFFSLLPAGRGGNLCSRVVREDGKKVLVMIQVFFP